MCLNYAQQHQQQNKRDGHSEEPQDDGHNVFSEYLSQCVRVTDFRQPGSCHLESRSKPPSAAPSIANKAPASKDAASHIANLAAALRALSAACFACSIALEIRCSASDWFTPVCADTTRAR